MHETELTKADNSLTRANALRIVPLRRWRNAEDSE
jgi:hypothetical protein